jgi:hypothetical protein
MLPAFLTVPSSERWPAQWKRPAFRWRLGIVLGLLLTLLPILPGFYHWVQSRPGRLLPDWLLAQLPVRDVALPTFTAIYGSIVLALIYLLPRPLRLLHALWAYFFLQLLRIITLTLLPLDPPQELIVLHDPVTEALFHASTHAPIVRDLFFSNHTATMVLLVLVVHHSRLRLLLALATTAVALLVLVQRAHYSYDVLAAPLFAGLAYWTARKVMSSELR